MMKKIAVVQDVELNSLGEFRMGCEAYGITINTNFGDIETFKDVPIMIGQTDYSRVIEQSSCKRYLLIIGAFATYILDIKEQTISVYRATVRGVNNEWCEENPIYGKETHHVNGLSRHYYLQFPFVKKEHFHQVFGAYTALRKRQIEEATAAL